MSALLYSGWVVHLAEPAVRALALAMVIGVTLALVRVKGVSLRLVVWTGVLGAALAMPILGWVLPAFPLRLPLPDFSARRAAGGSAVTPSRAEAVRRAAKLASEPSSPSSFVGKARPLPPAEFPPAPAPTPRQKRAIPWRETGAIVYVVAAAWLALRLALGWHFGRKLARGARRVEDARSLGLLREQAAALALGHLPALAVSDSVTVPVSLGILRPVILLPSDSNDWDESKWRAVLAHELSHVARRDALTFLFSNLHRCLFWFSPLAWWLDRKLTSLAEQASDEWALGRVEDRFYYAEILLGFWKKLEGTPARVRWEGASMAKGLRTHERLERILNARANWSKRIPKPLAAALALAAVPVLYFAAAVEPALAPQAPPAPAVAPAASAAPAPAPAPVKPPVGIYSRGPAPLPPAVGRAAPRPPAFVVTPPAAPGAIYAGPAVAAPPAGAGQEYLYGGQDYGFAEESEPFVIVSGHSHMMSGNEDDLVDARSYRHKIQGDYIWFRRDGKEYIIRDKATVERAKALFAPQDDLGRKQEALGKMQEQLGAQQEALGKRMEEMRVPPPDLMKEIKKLEAALANMKAQWNEEDFGRLQSELGEMQSRIAQSQAMLGEARARLGAEQGALGEKQGALGAEQGKLGREQGRLAREASRQMRALMDEALKNKTAEPAPQ